MLMAINQNHWLVIQVVNWEFNIFTVYLSKMCMPMPMHLFTHYYQNHFRCSEQAAEHAQEGRNGTAFASVALEMGGQVGVTVAGS